MDMYQETADFLRNSVSPNLRKPRVAIICGSGLGGLADSVDSEEKNELNYATIPNFPLSTGKTTLATRFNSDG